MLARCRAVDFVPLAPGMILAQELGDEPVVSLNTVLIVGVSGRRQFVCSHRQGDPPAFDPCLASSKTDCPNEAKAGESTGRLFLGPTLPNNIPCDLLLHQTGDGHFDLIHSMSSRNTKDRKCARLLPLSQ